MFITIYFDNKPLFICNEIDPYFEAYLHHDDAIFIDELNTHSVKTMIYEMQLPKVHAGIFFHPDFEALKKAFFKKFVVIQAAGGMVLNENNEVLMILRKGKWDLPKGKLDAGETIEICATREVSEETGVEKPEIVSGPFISYHTYHEGTRYILKESYWYQMKVKGKQELVPQIEEQITEIRWVPQDDLQDYLKNSFALIADVINAFKT